ncbi:MFS general substrate transporter [Auricularia subglabra TFB-10046 SS5]|nr:MFS general substrate transporter [Auricularia subglabra TFB-10046 SS5]
MSSSRPRLAKSRSRASRDSRVFIPSDQQALLVPEGDVGSSTADLLDIVDPAHAQDSTLVEEDAEDDELEASKRVKKPWYKTPSPWWIIGGMPLASIAMSTTIAPRVQIYTRLACMVHRPEYMSEGAKAAPTVVDGWGMPPPQGPTLGNHTLVIPVVLPEHDTAANNTIPSPSHQCASDPVVKAAVAKLIAVMSSTMGILGCITTAWWGQLSDRWGRTPIMRVAVAGMLFADFNFIVVSRWSHLLPGGYWFLLMSSVVDGLLGGLSTASSTMHAYVSDCTEPMHRAKIFSFSAGLLFSGLAIGPTLGVRIIHHTGDLLSVFYFAAAVHLLTATIWSFFVPESLPDDVRALNIANHEERQRREAEDLHCRRRFTWRAMFGFLAPLAVILPRWRDPLRREKGKDWNLTFLALAHGCALMLMASYQYKFQYAADAFNWSTERMGYWLSMVGVARAIHLLVVLPVIIKLFKPRPESIQLEGEENDLAPPRAAARSLSRPPPASRAASVASAFREMMTHPGMFDLALARGSLVVDVLSYVGTLFATTGGQFTAATLFGAFGGGLSPAIHSLALILNGTGEAGKLFGALSVLQTLCSQVIGPSLFGIVVVKTAGWFSKSIFVVALCAIGASLIFTLLIRLPPVPVERTRDREATLVADEVPRANKRAGKAPAIVVDEA